MNRENIYADLFSKVSQNASLAALVKTFGRMLKHWSDVPAGMQPAIYMVQGTETPIYVSGNMPPKWELHPTFYIYVSTSGDSQRIPAQLMNPIMDAFFDSLTLNPITHTMELGGKVWHCRIQNIETDEGVLGEQGVSIIPIDIIAT